MRKVLIFCLAIAIPILPWVTKNLYETLSHGQKIQISSLMNGYQYDRFSPDRVVEAPSKKKKAGKIDSQKNESAFRCGDTGSNEDYRKFVQENCGVFPFFDNAMRSTYSLPHLSRLFYTTPLFAISVGYLVLVG